MYKPRNCIISTPGPHIGNPKSSRAAPGTTPVDNPHAEVEIKTQLKPKSSVAKEEDPKPSHQLYKLQIKSTRSTRQILSFYGIYKRSLRVPTKENVIVLIPVDTGGPD